MQYIVPIFKWILPYLLKIADKYLPELLEYMINKIKEKKALNMGATLKITVKSKLGIALAGAALSFKVESTDQNKVTGDDGTCSVSGLPAGDYEITASKDGYTSNVDKITLVEGGSSNLDTVLENAVVEKTTTVIENTATKISEEIADVAEGDDTLSTAWSTIKGEIETGIDTIEGLIESLALDQTVVGQFTNEVTTLQTNINSRIDKYQKLLLDSRKQHNFIQCVGIDFEWMVIEVSQALLASKISSLKKKLTAKITSLTSTD